MPRKGFTVEQRHIRRAADIADRARRKRQQRVDDARHMRDTTQGAIERLRQRQVRILHLVPVDLQRVPPKYRAEIERLLADRVGDPIMPEFDLMNALGIDCEYLDTLTKPLNPVELAMLARDAVSVQMRKDAEACTADAMQKHALITAILSTPDWPEAPLPPVPAKLDS